MKRKGSATIKLVLQDTRIDDALARCIRLDELALNLEERVRKVEIRQEMAVKVSRRTPTSSLHVGPPEGTLIKP